MNNVSLHNYQLIPAFFFANDEDQDNNQGPAEYTAITTTEEQSNRDISNAQWEAFTNEYRIPPFMFEEVNEPQENNNNIEAGLIAIAVADEHEEAAADGQAPNPAIQAPERFFGDWEIPIINGPFIYLLFNHPLVLWDALQAGDPHMTNDIWRSAMGIMSGFGMAIAAFCITDGAVLLAGIREENPHGETVIDFTLGIPLALISMAGLIAAYRSRPQQN